MGHDFTPAQRDFHITAIDAAFTRGDVSRLRSLYNGQTLDAELTDLVEALIDVLTVEGSHTVWSPPGEFSSAA
jgi:hypothetical protein